MALPVWYVDGRTVRTKAEMTRGITNPFLNIADLRNLNDIIYQVIYNTLPNTPTGPLSVYNGVTGVVTSTTYDITLGGSLTQDTTIDGDSNAHVFNFDNLSEFNVVAEGVVLQGSSSINLQTPDIIALTATAGQVLTLIDDATGECEWQDIPSATIEVDNGLHLHTGVAHLGGTLIENTNVNGDTLYDMLFEDINRFEVISDVCSLYAASNMFFQTPEVANSTALENYILRLTDAGTGEVEFKANNIFPITATAGNINLDLTHHTVLVTTGGGNINVNLPDAALYNGLTYVIKQIGTGTTTIASVAQDIYSTSQVSSVGTTTSGETITLQAYADGLNSLWYVLK